MSPDDVDELLPGLMCQDVAVAKRPHRRSPIGQVTTIGLDIAKDVFQVHGIDAAWNMLIRRKSRRGELVVFINELPAAVVGIENCATSHHWTLRYPDQHKV